MSQVRQKFATQVNPEILAVVRSLAEKEGRQLQALVDEALAELIEKHKNAQPVPPALPRFGYRRLGMRALIIFTRKSPNAAANITTIEAARRAMPRFGLETVGEVREPPLQIVG